MSNEQKLAEILQALVAQELIAATDGSAKYLVMQQALTTLQQIIQGENNGN